MPNTVRVATQVTGVGKSSSELDRLRDKFDKLQKQGAKGFAIGAGAAVTTAGFGLLDRAASAAFNVLENATRAALEEEASISKLGAALKANIPAWDGNTAAIEKVLKSRMALGFSDDEQRQSLALLVAATHDSTKALDVQRIAMDLARFKGISLADATEALTRVEAGSYRILKSLGIVLKAGATQTQALAAVQAVANGQAEQWAATTEGKLTKAQIALNEALEKLGKVTLPAVAAGADTAANAFDGLGTAFAVVSGDAPVTAEGLKDVAIGVEDLLGSVPMLGSAFKVGAQGLRDWKDASVDAGAASIEAALIAHRAGERIENAVTEIGPAAAKTARTVRRSLGDIADAFDATWSELSGAADQAAEDIFGPLERRAELVANELAQSAAMGELQKPRQKGETGLDFEQRVAGARLELIGLQDDYAKLSFEMAGRGELTATEIKKVSDALLDELKTATREESVSILALIALFARLKTAAQVNFGPGDIRTVGGRRASGGPVAADKAYVVGEKGPELFVPNTGGAILRNGGSGSSMSMGDTSAILNALNQQTAYLARIAAGEPNVARPMTARGDLARQAALMPGGRL